MSHFSVLVIGPDVEKQLQPFHEFECTGIDDEFVVDVDRTEEARADFAGSTDSLTFAPWVEVNFGWAPVAFGGTPDLEHEHKYGYVITDAAGDVVQCIERTNPNGKWDLWLMGGRWTGFFALKPGAEGICGCPGLMTEPAKVGWADQAKKGDIDFARMRDEAGDKAAANWDRARALTGGASWESWAAARDRLKDIDAARDAYNGQPAIRALRIDSEFSWWIDDTLSGDRNAHVQAARIRAVSTFAVLYRGEWSSRGEMGWFGFSDDKMSRDEWDRLLNELIDGLPEDALLTLVAIATSDRRGLTWTSP